MNRPQIDKGEATNLSKKLGGKLIAFSPRFCSGFTFPVDIVDLVGAGRPGDPPRRVVLVERLLGRVRRRHPGLQARRPVAAPYVVAGHGAKRHFNCALLPRQLSNPLSETGRLKLSPLGPAFLLSGPCKGRSSSSFYNRQ